MTSKNIYSVEQVNKYIKNMFVQDYLLTSVCVRGEVSNCKYNAAGGHIYFTLKDAASSIKCVMFAGNRGGLSFRLCDGQQVVVTGGVDVYLASGQYQLYARRIDLDGEGALYEKFERLKAELEEEGMFDPTYKRPIPKNAKTIGIVTAPGGAAVRDIIDVSKRRNPYIQLVLYPAVVQGAEAAPSIVKGIQALEKLGVDLMIVGRGGGSIEDLWAFNERIVAQAIFDCSIPIISAVGHEIDFTIADFVSDLRAPTPSAAAELAVRELRDIDKDILMRKDALEGAMYEAIRVRRERLYRQSRELNLLSPQSKLRASREKVARYGDELERRMNDLLEDRKHRLALCITKIEGLSPLKRLESGYAYVADENGKRVTSVKSVAENDSIDLAMKDGHIKAVVRSVET